MAPVSRGYVGDVTVKPLRLDHVAVRISDPERTAAALIARFPFRILERGDDFLLVGRSRELGKITLFGAPGPRERESLISIGIGIPGGTMCMTVDAGELPVQLVPTPPACDVDLHHVAFRVPVPERSAERWLRYGFERAEPCGGVRRVRLGGATVELRPGSVIPSDRPMMGHLGLVVDSLDDMRRELEGSELEITREVDARSSRALFVDGPDGIELEYIEHKRMRRSPASVIAAGGARGAAGATR